MGRKPGAYPGVEARETTLRIWFGYQGRRRWEPLNLTPSAGNLKAAAKIRATILEEIKNGVFDYAEHFPDSPHAPAKRHVTFEDLACDWLAIHTDLAASTLNGYRKLVHQLYIPQLGDQRIDQIPHRTIAKLLAEHPWASQKTRNNALTPLRGIFDMAVAEGLVAHHKHPMLLIKSRKAQLQQPDPLELEEVEAVLDWLRHNRPEPCWNYYEFAFFAGPRTSELVALSWPQIDFKSAYARVDRAKVLKRIKTTKTNQVRDIELNSRALAALKRQKPHTYLADAEVFLDPITGKPYVGDKPPRLVWDAALKALGIRRRTAYNTRHTFATMNLMAGANPMWVARQMGHVNMKMLLERYARWIDRADKSREKAKLEQAIRGARLDSRARNRIAGK